MNREVRRCLAAGKSGPIDGSLAGLRNCEISVLLLLENQSIGDASPVGVDEVGFVRHRFAIP